ncbi:MAG: efflux RND transporter periplasmic adaptor subunit [Gloeocapsa sp. UFS-A4-WI-NPMV-4B04]|nr:efflux RND transporter periplasmic adaptor subunit [Gloeocapsa sp. UFS-A4-WI-NPMV-4B04]
MFCRGVGAVFLGVALMTAGCGNLPKEAADAQSQQKAAGTRGGPASIEVAIARNGKLQEEPEYTGTTVPLQEVSLRAQVEGRVLALNVDVGDTVRKGQAIARIDDALLRTALNADVAELAALRAEVARAQNQVSNAKAQVEQARLELGQSQSDSQRQQRLFREGAIAAQTAEQTRTTARTAAQALRAATEQVQTEQQAVAAAQERVSAQQAVVAQAQEQLSYAQLTSPISGIVTQKITEEGNLVQPNGEVLKIGDFSRVHINVEVSELALANLRVGQSAGVRLDAFPDQTFRGQVTRISPAADPTARLVPIEVTIPNSNGRIGSGLLARVSFEDDASRAVVVPETAIVRDQGSGVRGQGAGEQGSRGAGEQGSRGAGKQGNRGEILNSKSIQNQTGTLFVVNGGEGGSKATVTARAVTLGERANGNVEILSGLKPGERFVAQSGRPLKNGETVGISIISETAQGEQQ